MIMVWLKMYNYCDIQKRYFPKFRRHKIYRVEFLNPSEAL